MKPERMFKNAYLFLSDLSYTMIIITPIIATLFTVLFFFNKQIVLANILLICVIILLIYLFIKIDSLKNKINYTIANYIVSSYLIDSEIHFLTKIAFEINKQKVTVDYIAITEKGIILIDIYDSYCKRTEESAKFSIENEIISKIKEMILNIENNTIDFNSLPITYIVAYANNLLYTNNKDNKDEIKQFVRKNVYEVPLVISKFKEQPRKINYTIEDISALYSAFRKISLDYYKKRKK